MGKTLILLTLAIATIFSAIIVNVQKNSNKIPNLITEKDFSNELDNLGKFAINHGIRYFRDNYTAGNSSFAYSNWHVINMQNGLGKIKSITYTPEGTDFWWVNATVSKTIKGHEITKTVRAKLSYQFTKPLSQFQGYSFDKVQGNKLIDDSGNGYDATIHGTSFETGKFGNAIKSDQLKEYDYTDNSPNSEFDPHMQFTIATWVKLDFPSGGLLGSWTTTSSNIISNISTNTYRPAYTLYVVATRIKFLWWWLSKKLKWVFAVSHGANPQYVDVTESFGKHDSMETWHYVVATYDGNYSSNRALIKIWVKNVTNGKIYQASKVVKRMSAIPNKDITYLGSAPNEVVTGLWSFIRALINMLGNIFNPTGNIMDELGVYHEILSPQQINDLINQNGTRILTLENVYNATPMTNTDWQNIWNQMP